MILIGTSATLLGAVLGGFRSLVKSDIKAEVAEIKIEVASVKADVALIPFKVDSVLEIKIKPLERVFSLSDAEIMTKRIVNNAVADLKIYTDLKNDEQNDRFEEYYVSDDRDTTFKLVIYRLDNGEYIPINQTYISTNDFNNLNN